MIIDIEGLQGFVPASQVATLERTSDPNQEGISPLAKLVGSERSFKVLELDRGRNRVILSEKAALQEWRQQQKDRLLEDLQEGQTHKGQVTGISSFGAFVDLGGADGLIHISELSWSPIASPEEVVKVGDEVEVYILRVDKENKKIGLSLRRLQQEPWDSFAGTFFVGDFIQGVVTKLASKGTGATKFVILVVLQPLASVTIHE